MKFIYFFSTICVLLVMVYLVWRFSGREEIPLKAETGELTFSEHGQASTKGNFVSIQPYMLPEDYQSQNSFYNKLDYYFNVAQQRDWFSDKTIVVLPEYLGTWLVTAGEKRQVYLSKTIQEALTTMVTSNLFAFIRAYFKTRGNDKVKDAVFRMKAGEMANVYSTVFSSLAKQYRVTIVAGSIILPEPSVHHESIRVGEGRLYNVAFLFHPDGSIDKKITIKAYPTADENQFISAGSTEAIPVYETEAGRLGIAVCADSWYPDIYSHFEEKEADLLAVPSFLIPDGIMDRSWLGYSGRVEPNDVDATDVESITEGQAWEKYALLGRFEHHGFQAGVNVFMRGQLWDLGSDGRTYSFLADSSFIGQRLNASEISCLWF